MSRHDWGLRLPPGWLDCPPYGQQIRTTQNQTFPVIASKVPLSRDWDQVVPKEYRYTPRMAVEQVTARFGVRVRMIVDLTNSHRYYNFANEFPDAERMQLAYVKVPCRGKGQTPTPESVNEVVYEMYRLLSYYQDSVVLMHCTHGFNRTGYMIVNAMARMAAGGGMAVDRCLRRFAEARPPGVYKDHYITQLFKYHHEQRPAGLLTPPVPAWKGVEGEEEEEELPPQDPAPPNAEMRHDLIEAIGEGITRLEAEHVQSQVYELITGQPPHEGRMHFPGSQPVSLARANLGLLQHQRYWVSWKADGTRYLLLVVDRGAYLVDRSFKVVRLQMRFPKPGHPPVQQHHGQTPIADYPVSRPHSLTLMDGEMVVDHAADGYHRRYLVYDMAVCNGKPLMTEKWIKRFEAVRTMVIDPRSKEQNYIQGITPRAKYMAPPLGYDYGAEPFSVRLKDFWPLYHARKVIHQMIPSLSHEADGLILQSCDSMYVANTDNALLKFKFAHLNSVDFHVKVQQRNGQEEVVLMVMDTQGRRQRGPDGPPLKPIHGELERLSDPAVTLASLHDRIVECTWVPSTRCWRYLRVREDKQRPNASHVYDKVVQSIADDIREGELLDYLEAVYYHVPAYEKDRSIMQDKHRPSQLPPPPPPSDQYGRLMHQMGGGPPSPPHSHHHGRQNGGPASGPGPGRGEVNNWDHHGNSLPGPPPPLGHGPEQGGEPHPQSAPEGYVPRSPPYFGPEPTPPPSPSNGGQSPRRPHCWVAHDPATYPSEFLELPPPPQPPQHRDDDQPDRPFHDTYDDERGRRHGSQAPPEYEDKQQYHRQGHGPGHSQHPAYREQLPLNPSYVDEDPGIGPPHSAAPALPVAPQRQAPPPARVVSRPVKSVKRKALGESKPSARSQPKASAYANDFDDLNDDSGQF